MTLTTTTRRQAELADGRDIFYFTAEPTADEPAPDRREDLTPTVVSSQIRWNPLFRDYAAIAGHRQTRTYKPPTTQCPLCPSHGDALTEVPAPDYEVVVFENRFPSFALDASAHVPTVDAAPFRSGPGDGRCEVVCFSSDHDTSFAYLPVTRVRTVIDAWADRTAALAAEPSIDYVFCFENRGEEIGVTLSHPHGQIYGYPFVPPRFYTVTEALSRHREKHGTCLQCTLLDAEVAEGTRVVTESEHWVGYVPFAARWPYEVRVVPRAHVPDLPSLDDAQRDDLAALYVDVLHRFDGLFGEADGNDGGPASSTPYIAGWQQSPTRGELDPSRADWHLAAEIFTIRRAPGRLKYLAGSESGAGVWINDVSPEDAAARLRDAG